MSLFRHAGNWIIQHPFKSAALVTALTLTLTLLAVAILAVLVLATILLAAIFFAAPITIPAASVVLGLAGFTGAGIAGVTASSVAGIVLAGIGHVFAKITFNAIARGIAAVITATSAAISSHVQIEHECERERQDGAEPRLSERSA